jgi:hypothetical protein
LNFVAIVNLGKDATFKNEIKGMCIVTLYYFPSITPNHYAEIKKLFHVDPMPESFGNWRAAQDAERHAHLANGDTVVPVGIDLIDVQVYCKAMNYQPDKALLGKLAAKLAGDRKLRYPFTPTGSVPRS